MDNKPPKQKLVLVGGGHSHAIALRLWGLNPLPRVDLTLISDVEQTPYSGMLPGHVAGYYSYAQTHINLRHLANFAGAKLKIDRAVALNLTENEVSCQSGDRVKFDYLSLDIGSTPQTITVPGAAKYAIPAKPVPQFLDAWYQLKQQAITNPSLSIVIVGGGAGGVELALNMQTGLQAILPDSKDKLTIHLIHRGDRLMSGHNDWVSNKLEKIIRQRGIQLHLQQEVSKIQADRVSCRSGLSIEYTHLFWVTQAVAPSWLEKSNLSVNQQGFVLVTDTLQSISHPHVLAAGDIATMVNYKRPKAGVFAVRQGKPLYSNWQNLLTNQQLQNYRPQSKYLALIGTGNRKAIASWSKFGWHSALFWQLKDYIDCKFMAQFEDFTKSVGKKAHSLQR